MTEQVTERPNEYTSISLPTYIVTKIDSIVKQNGYLNRADFVRDAIREAFKKYEPTEANPQ
jgi:metal-responsive CopG/Arc/MetJ family transcriptional regulator